MSEEIANLKRIIDRISKERDDAKKRVAFLEELVDEFVDSLDGEPTGGDQLDFLLQQYGYVPTKGVPG